MWETKASTEFLKLWNEKILIYHIVAKSLREKK